MGDFANIFNEKNVTVIVEQSIKNIAEELEKINTRLEKIEKDFYVGIQVGKNATDQKLALASTILKMSAAPACFIPFCGPIVGTILAGASAYIAPGNSSMNMGAGVIAAANRANLNTFSKDSNPNPLLKLMSGGVNSSGDPNNPYLTESVGKVVWLYGDALDTVANLYKTGFKVGEFQQAIKIVGKVDAATDAKRYQIAIEQNVNTITASMQENPETFLPLIFWKLCAAKDAKHMLSGGASDGKVLGEFAKQTWGSKYRGLAKQDFTGIRIYNDILGDGTEENQDRAVTPIYLEKLRLFAYRQRYSESLKKDIGDNFALLITKKYEPSYNEPGKGIFDKRFYANEISTVEDCLSLTRGFSLSISSADQFRRRTIYSWYCFNQILKAHLGTFILSSLPTLGTDPSVDRRVMFAIIDATATAWWATTRAFNASGPIRFSNDLNSFRIRASTLKKLPYISNYFNPVNIFYNYLTQNPDRQDPNQKDRSTTTIRLYLDTLKLNLENIKVNKLMPGNNNNHIQGLDGWSKAYIEALYEELFTGSLNNYYDQAMERISNDLKSEYLKLSDPDNEFAGLYSLFDDVEIDDELVKNIANVHMGSLVNASSPTQLNQAEFNRSVARAFKSLVTHMGKKGLL